MSILTRAVALAGATGAALVLAAGPALAAPNEQDTAFLVGAHQGNLAEIAAGTAAQEQATTDTVRELGALFIEHHTRLDGEVTAVAEELGVELPDTPREPDATELARVEQQEGEAFDTAWIAQQIAAHERSRAAGQEEIAEGQDEAVVALARESAPVIEDHLARLRAAAEEYGVPTSVPGGTGGQAATSPVLVGVGVAATGALLLAGSGVVLLRRRGEG